MASSEARSGEKWPLIENFEGFNQFSKSALSYAVVGVREGVGGVAGVVRKGSYPLIPEQKSDFAFQAWRSREPGSSRF